MTEFDRDLTGLWIIPGAARTYEVEADGGFHVADPAAALSFDQDGRVMDWGGQRLTRVFGSGAKVEGTWRSADGQEDWTFRPDGAFELRIDGPKSAPVSGIWALRDEGAALWTRERRARIEANGAELVFHTADAEPARYGYTVQDGEWTLMDHGTWTKLAVYRRVEI